MRKTFIALAIAAIAATPLAAQAKGSGGDEQRAKLQAALEEARERNGSRTGSESFSFFGLFSSDQDDMAEAEQDRDSTPTN